MDVAATEAMGIISDESTSSESGPPVMVINEATSMPAETTDMEAFDKTTPTDGGCPVCPPTSPHNTSECSKVEPQQGESTVTAMGVLLGGAVAVLLLILLAIIMGLLWTRYKKKTVLSPR